MVGEVRKGGEDVLEDQWNSGRLRKLTLRSMDGLHENGRGRGKCREVLWRENLSARKTRCVLVRCLRTGRRQYSYIEDHKRGYHTS